MIILFVVFSLAVVYLLMSIKVVQHTQVMVIERLGNFYRILYPGINLILPFLDIAKKLTVKKLVKTVGNEAYYVFSQTPFIDLREIVFDCPRQKVITKDNVTISINVVLYFQIVDPKSAVYKIENLPEAITRLTQTAARNVIGGMDLDTTLISRYTINEKLRTIIDEEANEWGVKINRIELQDIIPPQEIQASMENE